MHRQLGQERERGRDEEQSGGEDGSHAEPRHELLTDVREDDDRQRGDGEGRADLLEYGGGKLSRQLVDGLRAALMTSSQPVAANGAVCASCVTRFFLS